MYPVGWVVVVNLILLIWLFILSYLFWKERKFLYKLFPKSDELDIRKKFEELIAEIEESGRKNQILARNLQAFRKEGLGHIQDIAMLRYNPYNDTGGVQSFSVVFLDALFNGVLLTSLHSRAGTRIYIKNINAGISDLELSKEESQVLEQAVSKKSSK